MDTQSEQLRQYLKTILRRTALLHFGSGMVSFAAVGAWVFLALVLWTAAAHEPGRAAVTIAGRGALLVLVAAFGYFVVWPLARMPRLEQLAAEVERRKDLREIVRAGFEFSQDEGAERRYSGALVREVIRQAVEKVSGLQVRNLFLSRRVIALVPVAFGGLLVLLVAALVSPSLLSEAGRRMASPSSAATGAHRANIYAQPGDVTVLAGSDVTVTGLDLGRSQHDVAIAYTIAEDFWKTEPTERVARETEAPAGERQFDKYEYTFRDLRHTVRYAFAAGDYHSPTYTITVVHEPILTAMRVTLTPPAYTGEAPAVFEDNGGNVQALEGTKVEVVGTTNNPLAAAWVRFDDKEKEAVSVAGREVRFGFTALEDGHYSVLLQDTLGFDTGDPLVYAIEVFQDHAPSIDVIAPGADAMLPRNRKLDVGFVAADDYGVRSAAILFRKTGETEFSRLNVPLGDARGRKEVAAAYAWDLSEIELFPGNSIEYYVQVVDNNVVTGPGVARSKTFLISVPTMAELYERVKEADSQRDDMMEQAIRDSQEFQERLEKIAREFTKTEQMEWTQKKEVDKALETQKAVEEKLQDVRQSLDETMRSLSENRMTSQEIGEKMEEIRELLDEIDSKELREYMENLREAVEKMKPEDIRQALENMQVSAEEMLAKLERTAELLKQIAKEQKMEELVRKSRDLMDAQRELSEQTREAEAENAQRMDELSREQNELARDAEGLQQSMEDFSEMMEQEDPQTAGEMGKMSKEMKSSQGPQKNMKQAARDLDAMQQEMAMQQQQEAMEKMISLFQRMVKTQQGMQMNMGRRLSVNLQKFARQTLELSHRQEALASTLQGDVRPGDPTDMQRAAQDQMSYLKATEKIADEMIKMEGQTLRLSPGLMRALGDALDRMQNSVLFLEQNKPFMSTAHANNAVESLNEATIEMLRSAKQCASGSAGGSQSLAQQLMQQLIPQQQDVMQQTRAMLEMEALGEAMRQERQAQMERLAGQQRSLQDIAKQIQESMKQNRDLLGRLDRTVEDMEAVVESLERGNLDQELVQKEQHILSRLLDAQRSIHSRDYEKERRSVTAEDVFSRSLGGAKDEPTSQSLREEIRRAMQLKAPGEFEDLIKMYFRALAEESALRDVRGN